MKHCIWFISLIFLSEVIMFQIYYFFNIFISLIIVSIFNYKSSKWMRKKNFVSSKRHVHNGLPKKIVVLNMCCASLTKLVGTNRNACFTISKSKFLINQNLKLCVSSIQSVQNLAVLLNTKNHLRNPQPR